MKKVLLVLSMVLAFNLSNAQERVNGTVPVFGETIGKLNEFIGWEFNETTEQWRSNKGSTGGVHLVSILTNTIDVDSVTFYLLNISYMDGHYKYPSIKKGFISYVVTSTYIYTKEEFDLLKIGQTTESKLKSVRTISDKMLTDAYHIKNCISIIKENQKKYEHYNNSFEVKVLEDGKTIRFYPPTSRTKSIRKYYPFDVNYFELSSEDYSTLFN